MNGKEKFDLIQEILKREGLEIPEDATPEERDALDVERQVFVLRLGLNKMEPEELRAVLAGEDPRPPAPERPPKRILVTGGCGFLGSHVVDVALERGHEVVVLDNLSSCWLEEERAEDPRFRREEAMYFVNEDASLTHLILGEGLPWEYEAVIHLACRHPVERERATFRAAWEGYVNGGVRLLLNLLDWQAPLERFVFCASLGEISAEGRGPVNLVLDRALTTALAYWHRPPNLGVYYLLAPELTGDRRLPEAEIPDGAETAPVEDAARKLVDLADGTERHKRFPGVGLGPARLHNE